MKKMGSDKKEAAPVAPQRAGTKTTADASASKKGSFAKNPPIQATEEHHEAHHLHGLHVPKLHKPDLNKLKKNCKHYCALITYVVLGVLAILISIAVIVITSIASVAIKTYDTEQSSRLVSNIVLAVTAAISLSMIIYAIVGAFRRNPKPVHATGVVLLILAVIQALIAGLAITVTSKDVLSIAKSLSDSLRLSKENNQRHVALWTATQHDLQCCGVFSPEDYRDTSFPYTYPPNIPISCCPSYDPSKPLYIQEKQRNLCRSRGEYFDTGCRDLVVEVFKETSIVIIAIVAVLIILEILVTFQGAFLNRKKKSKDRHDEEAEQHEMKK